MLVFLAETGTSIQISKPIKSHLELAKEIEYFVPINSQIILTGNGEAWKGDSEDDDGSVFVFNRLVLDPKYSSNATAQSIDIEPPVPSSTVTTVPQLLPSSSLHGRISLQEKVDSFITAFKSHVPYGKALLGIAQKHFATCQKLLEEQRIQTKALDIAIQNLDSHAKSTFETFNAFNTHAQKEFTKHSSLLHSCPADLNTLAQIPIHHSILADNRKLDDYVPKEKLYAWVNRCQESHDHLLQKANQLMESMQEIRNGCNIDQLKMTGVEFPKLVKLLETSGEVVEKMGIIYSSFERDSSRVYSTCQDILSSPSQAENRLQAVESLYAIHSQEYIPEITKYDRYVRETVIYFSDSKVHLTQVLQSKLQTISHFQSLIAAVTPSITTLTNALNMQSEALLQLLHVHRMAPAWGATLVEIVRRKEYVRIFLQKAKEMADILNQFRTQEQRRRDTFKSEILRYIPAGLIQGLEEAPPYCEISVSNTKDSLPNLVTDDIQAFERMVSSIKPSHISGDPAVASSDSISKLQATMLKMLPQLENIGLDFERIVAKTGFYTTSNNQKLEEENRRLKQQLSSVKSTPGASEYRPTPTIPSPEQLKHQDASLYPKQEEMIKAYESRIKSLERVLQERYNVPTTPISDPASAEEIKQLRSSLAEEKRKGKEQADLIRSLALENQGFLSQVAALNDRWKIAESQSKEMADTLVKEKEDSEKFKLQILNFEKESVKQKQLLVQVSAHLHSCLASLKSSEDSIVHLNSIVIPDSIHSDNLQQMMRKVEDDIISQMALLANLKALHESVGGAGSSEDAQSVAHEMVGLLQRISELELVIKEAEAELTQVQAKEAVVEAECNSVKKILSKTTESLEQHQSSLRSLNEELEREKSQKQGLEEQCARLKKMHEEKNVAIRGFEERILQQSRKTMPDQGLQLLLHSKDSQLRVCRDALEDWAIISKLSVDFMSKCYTDFSQIQSTLGMNPNPEISCRDILALEVESLPEELDPFLAVMTVLIKQTYEKVVAMAVMSSSAIALELRTQFKAMKFDLGKRITFQKFQVSSLCLFLPTKNPAAWAAFHVDSPHYFLAPESHPSFDARIKKREWILGTISDISSFTVGQDGDSNRFALANGTTYHVCSAVPFQ